MIKLNLMKLEFFNGGYEMNAIKTKRLLIAVLQSAVKDLKLARYISTFDSGFKKRAVKDIFIWRHNELLIAVIEPLSKVGAVKGMKLFFQILLLMAVFEPLSKVAAVKGMKK